MVGIGINLLVAVIGLPLILFMWGFQPGDIQAWIYKFATEIHIGSVTFSLTGILSRHPGFRHRLFRFALVPGAGSTARCMARGRVDAGVRNSIRTAVGYAGILLAALLGVSAAGIDLSNIALVAGALSLGIGFGLQNIVSNFVSGLILLAERPFKVGDWVVAGANSGMVKKISVRATEIETFQRQTVIVPNSEFINSAVGNWTHRNKLGRIDVKVNVAYGTDARRAAEVMDAVVRSHPLVLKNPEPFVVFLNFGPAALEFELRFFLADILNANVVQNDIRFAILETFERERIEIPSNPRAVDPRFAAAAGRAPRAAAEERCRRGKAGRRAGRGQGEAAPGRAGMRCRQPFSCRSASISYKVAVTVSKDALQATRGGGDTGTQMWKFGAAILMLAAINGAAHAASAVNLDNEPRTLIVTEGGSKSELAVGAGETVEFCPTGCFVTLPNGDREALTGSETIEISGGQAKIK